MNGSAARPAGYDPLSNGSLMQYRGPVKPSDFGDIVAK
jgi:hypothetical protein